LSEVSDPLLVAGTPCVHPYLGKSALPAASRPLPLPLQPLLPAGCWQLADADADAAGSELEARSLELEASPEPEGPVDL
jgi:hypothetical protein